MKPFSLSVVLGLTALGAVSFARAPLAGELVAIKAGRIHTMDQAGVVEDGVLLIRDGRIVALGKDLTIPAGTQVVDYGPDADLIPGLVAAGSGLARGSAGDRSADASILAVDGFDTFANRASLLAAGVTSAYVDPAAGRFLGGIGGVVKLGGDADRRVVSSWASLDGSISSDAYDTPGFWEPPVPATADVGMGVEESQLPHSLQGAVMGLGQLADIASGVEAGNFDSWSVV
ncbi:MAG: hypothetical protein H8D72_01140 [Planctomycetes bacterium]|nr:hypothetical protein [Planctomycetota bacterium]